LWAALLLSAFVSMIIEGANVTSVEALETGGGHRIGIVSSYVKELCSQWGQKSKDYRRSSSFQRGSGAISAVGLSASWSVGGTEA
jgi:hypothetical protein